MALTRGRCDMASIIIRWRMRYCFKPQTKVASMTVMYHSMALTPIKHHANTNLVKPRMLPFVSIPSAPSFSSISGSFQNHISTSELQSVRSSSSSSKTKNVSDVFLDNLGKIFFGAIASIIALLVRSSYGTSNQTRERETLEETSLLDPLEIDDLRSANKELFHNNSSLFKDIIIQTNKSFPTGWASYFDFVSVVMDVFGKTSSSQGGVETRQGSFLKFGHLIDRIVIEILENSDKYEGMIQIYYEEGKSGSAQVKLPLTFLLTILSLALPWSVDDRINSLFDILVAASSNNDFQEVQEVESRYGDRTNASAPAINVVSNNADQTLAIPEKNVIDMIGFLQASCQLPPGPQVLATDIKYPVQQYKRGTPNELMSLAKKDALGLVEVVEETSKDVTRSNKQQRRRYNIDEFNTLLRCNYVCAWGECYGPRKSNVKGKE